MNKKKHGKRFNRKIANWSYYQLEMLLTYKAEALGKSVEYVDPRFTSQRCNSCGHIARKNRNGSEFRCDVCGHKDGADVNAAKNIRDLWLKARNQAEEENSNPERAGTSPGAVCLPSWRKPAWDLTSLQARPVGN